MLICRVCKKELKDFELYLKLEDCPLTDEFLENNSTKTEFIKNIFIYKCNSCSIVQNPSDFDYSEYYQDYQYSSGGSEFTRRFMLKYMNECIKVFKEENEKDPKFILEPGSGDGEQLSFFFKNKFKVLGVEPSESLCKIANERNIKTENSLFNYKYVEQIKLKDFDICLSSYTLDHCPEPLDYLKAANFSLNTNGILAAEIHDLEKIIDRSEYCLFEHEHTIYLNKKNIEFILKITGFKVVKFNPISENLTRANSLIFIAKKVSKPYSQEEIYKAIKEHKSRNYTLTKEKQVSKKILGLISRLDKWVLCQGNQLVGYGAGGRGIMTLSQMKTGTRFKALLDKNFDNRNLRTPKTRVPIVGPSSWQKYNKSTVLVFSFGYYDEIVSNLVLLGFNKDKIISLESFFE